MSWPDVQQGTVVVYVFNMLLQLDTQLLIRLLFLELWCKVQASELTYIKTSVTTDIVEWIGLRNGVKGPC